MDTISRLNDIEAVKQLKARYCRHLDNKDWQAFRDLFCDDFYSDTRHSGGPEIHGADEFVAFVKKALGKSTRATVHQVHAPEIEITSDTTANGIWAMEDKVRFAPGLNMNGFGHYTESYEKVGGEWKIKSSTLTRLREDIFNSLFSLYIPNWLREKLIRRSRH